jgi:hypothetical protein
MKSTAALQRRISRLEANVKPTAGPPPQTHIVHGDTRAIRAQRVAAMIEGGQASNDDIFMLVVAPGESK